MDRSPISEMEKVQIARTAIQDFAFDDTLAIMPNLELSGYKSIARDAIFPAASQQGHAHQLFPQDIGENERCHDGGV